jgi:uncharacterized membrane protein YhaH (DUF805 family)
MEQTRKNFKTASIVVLIFAGLSLLSVIVGLIFGDFNSVEVPADAPENILLMTKTLLLVVSLIFLLPQVYIGVKGLKIAKTPDKSKGHIVWAVILLVFSVLSLITPVVNMVTQGDIMDNVGTLLGALLEVIVYYEYIKYAREVLKAN